RPRQGRAAVDTLRRLVEDHGFRCLKLNTLDDNYRLDDRRLVEPVVEAADRLGIPVFFHTGDTHADTCTPNMVADIALDFPNTTFIIGHMAFGGVNGYPGSTDQLIPAMERAPNTVTETAGVLKCSFIQDVVDRVGADRVLMGSNCPYVPMALPPVMIRDYMGRLSDEQKQAIMGGNLLRVLKADR
ncbi:MAG: amidohydrolase family protein, partial [Gemmatimonadetes bacterium]|nr:amidohydrolase family protein [Gemmatimonadota bacterium]